MVHTNEIVSPITSQLLAALTAESPAVMPQWAVLALLALFAAIATAFLLIAWRAWSRPLRTGPRPIEIVEFDKETAPLAAAAKPGAL